jgi:branched-chain amino acid transport system ATP-binding protein
MTDLLTVEAVDAVYGRSHVLHAVSLTVASSEVVMLLGRNGAGKTTTMRTIMGLVAMPAGRIRFAGQDISGQPPYRIAQIGIGLVPEDRRMFAQLSVRENLELGRKPSPPGYTGQPWDYERVFQLFPALKRLQERRAGTLSGGEQQMVAVARTLMGSPALLLLDEPAEGLAPIVLDALREQLQQLRADGMAMMISEQNLGFARALADRAYVLESGVVRYAGTLAELDANREAWSQYIAF